MFETFQTISASKAWKPKNFENLRILTNLNYAKTCKITRKRVKSCKLEKNAKEEEEQQQEYKDVEARSRLKINTSLPRHFATQLLRDSS